MHLGLILAALFAGFTLPFQAGANAALSRHTPTLFHAALVNFIVGGLVLACIALASPARAGFTWAGLGQVPWWGWLAGLLGAAFVTTSVKATPVLGATIFVALVIAGQMVASVAIDQFGLVGLDKRPISMERVLGLAFLVCGVGLLIKGR